MPKGVGYGKKGMKKAMGNKGGRGKNMGRKRFGSWKGGRGKRRK